jgi:aminoacyl tRNA synthase complex-interacting multifunctional protein 1
MSFQSAVAKLSPPIKELVLAVTENGIRYVGDSAQDQAEVTKWIEKAGNADVASEANLQVRGTGKCTGGLTRRTYSLQSLNSLLIPRTYLVSNYLTAADVAVYGTLHPTFVGVYTLPCMVVEYLR